MSIEPGAFVRHPGQPSWGNGIVLEMLAPGKVRVRFARAGEKVLLLSVAPLVSAQPLPSEEAFLVGPGPRPKRSTKPITPHEKLVTEFLWRFPGGFRSTAYGAAERDDKVRAHESAQAELSDARLRAAVEAGRFDDVVTSALHVMGATNLVFPNEQKALRDGLVKPRAREAFSRRLVDLLHGSGAPQARFEGFADFLLEVDAARWTLATYFPFIVFPKDHMFLRPEVTQKAAEAYGFTLAYDSRLNWKTYERLLAFSKELQERLAPLEPADLMDVQSFLWVVGAEGRPR